MCPGHEVLILLRRKNTINREVNLENKTNKKAILLQIPRGSKIRAASLPPLAPPKRWL